MTAPERRAANAGAGVLADGGTAVEAVIAMAAFLSVSYPHMTGVGGDAFWLVSQGDAAPVAILGCGRAGAGVSPGIYGEAIPARGPMAANTVAGAVSSWAAALALPGASRLPLSRLLTPAIEAARGGLMLAPSLQRAIAAKRAELSDQPGWRATYDLGGEKLALSRLANTLARLAAEGLESFYAGALAEDLAEDLATVGAPLTHADLAAHRATVEAPLRLRLDDTEVWGSPPPTQGLASLMILALANRLDAFDRAGFDATHRLVEAIKLAFAIRDREVFDPDAMRIDAQAMLDDGAGLDALAARVDVAQAAPWPNPSQPGDTCWMGAADADGCVVSMIQSIYFEFGSGVVLPRTGVTWQNRGSSFRLSGRWNALAPGRRPFHTLNPAMAQLGDGRRLAWGTMGGDGQPQTIAQVFGNHVRRGMSLADAIAAPRFLLGRTWGDNTSALRLEADFDPAVIDALRKAGHAVVMTERLSEIMGHAGAVTRSADGVFDGASDPRSDGAAIWA